MTRWSLVKERNLFFEFLERNDKDTQSPKRRDEHDASPNICVPLLSVWQKYVDIF